MRFVHSFEEAQLTEDSVVTIGSFDGVHRGHQYLIGSMVQAAHAAGFDGFIGKPIDPDRFPEQIRAILKGEAVWSMR